MMTHGNRVRQSKHLIPTKVGTSSRQIGNPSHDTGTPAQVCWRQVTKTGYEEEWNTGANIPAWSATATQCASRQDRPASTLPWQLVAEKCGLTSSSEYMEMISAQGKDCLP